MADVHELSIRILSSSIPIEVYETSIRSIHISAPIEVYEQSLRILVGTSPILNPGFYIKRSSGEWKRLDT